MANDIKKNFQYNTVIPKYTEMGFSSANYQNIVKSIKL